MVTETTDRNGVVELTLDIGKHVPAMRLAQANNLGQVAWQVAKAAIEEKEAPADKTAPESTRDKYFRNLYESTPEDRKPQALLKDFRDKNRVVETLRSVGFKGLEFEQVNTQSARDYNLSLLDR